MITENRPFPDIILSLESTVLASPVQITCELNDEAVILHLSDGVYYGLNTVASFVWELVQQPRTIREIRDSLLREYTIEESVCTRDLCELLVRLHACKLIVLPNGNGTPLNNAQ